MKNVSFRLASFFLRSSRGVVALATLVGIIAGISSVALMALINAKVARPDSIGEAFVWAFVGLAIVELLSNYASSLLTVRMAHGTSFDMRMRLSRQILAAPQRQLEEIGAHRILAALTQDISNLTGAYLRLPPLFLNMAVVAGCLVYLSWLSPILMLALVLFLIVSVVSWMIPEKTAKRYLKLAREQWDELVNHFHSMTEGSKELKLHRARREAFYTDNLEASAKLFKSGSVSSGSIYSFVNSWSQVLYFVVIGLMLFALPNLMSDVPYYVLTGFALTVLYMRGPLVVLLNIIPYFGSAQISLMAIEDLGFSLDDERKQESSPARTEPRADWGRLEMVGVTHTYYREKEDANFTLGPITLTLQRGELVFIVGGNGSGKTTLTKLLTGLYVPETGDIKVGGERVTDENREEFRQLFSAVFADFYLFPELLGLSNPELDGRARAYISQLQLDGKVKVKDGKLSTTELSFGQRKRLALLTAYLEDRPIYIFDEWSAGQDPYFKEIFYFQLLPELKAKGKTVVVVSHDDRYYHVADRVIKLENGQVEFDSVAEDDFTSFSAGNAPLVPVLSGQSNPV